MKNLNERETHERFVLAAVGINYDNLMNEININKDELLHNQIIVRFVLRHLRATSKTNYTTVSYTDIAKLADRTEEQVTFSINELIDGSADNYGLSLVKKEDKTMIKVKCTGKYKINDPYSKDRLDIIKTEEYHGAIIISSIVEYINFNKKANGLNIVYSPERLSFLTGIDEKLIPQACRLANNFYGTDLPGWKFN